MMPCSTSSNLGREQCCNLHDPALRSMQTPEVLTMSNNVREACVTAVLAVFFAGWACAQQPSTTLSPDETQIRRAVLAFVEQYNTHKAEGVAALFAPNA